MSRVEASKLLAGKRIRLLVVEDSEDDAFLLQAALRAGGAQLIMRQVDNAADMAAALDEAQWDAIICDHQMPGFDSQGALEVLRRSGQDIPFIIYSGQLSDQQGSAAMAAGVQDFIPKGNLARLLPVLERELRGAAVRRAVRQAGSRINELAFYDPLSRLPNQLHFRHRLDHWLRSQRAAGRRAPGAVFHVDVDRFLRINSSFGYEAGNRLLREVARRLSECVDGQGEVARLASDEFGVFCPAVTDARTAAAFGAWILKAFSAAFECGTLELYLTPSIGVALVAEHGDDACELLMSAETAMTSVKRAGGNAFRVYCPEMRASSAERLALETDLRHAVEREQLLLHFQPIVCAATGRIAGMEALLRWRHPRHGIIMPESFVPLADESGLIVEIGEWVLREVCRQGRRWQDLGYRDVSMAVNVSAVQFSQPSLLQVVREALTESGFRPVRLELEITESVLMHDAESTIGMLKALKNMGVRVSVDDFGTGYSSLSYLKRFPIDVIKIDRSFVCDLHREDENAAIVRAILALAKSMRLATIAEGVETLEQVEFLQAQRCERFQGFYFGHPVEPAAMAQRLTEEERQTAPRVH